MVVGLHCKPQLASHPAFVASLETLWGIGVTMVFGPEAPYEAWLPSWLISRRHCRRPPCGG
jgi:hypothetical protein